MAEPGVCDVIIERWIAPVQYNKGGYFRSDYSAHCMVDEVFWTDLENEITYRPK